MNSIPSKKDMNPYGDAKAAAAAQHFEGKTREQALQMFHEAKGIAPYLEDLYWMGPKAFDYYGEALRDYYHQGLDASSNRAEMVQVLITLAQERYNIHEKSFLSQASTFQSLLEYARPLLEADIQSINDDILRQHDNRDETLRSKLVTRLEQFTLALAALDDYLANGPQTRGKIWQKAVYKAYHHGLNGQRLSFACAFVLLLASFAMEEMEGVPSYVPSISYLLLALAVLYWIYSLIRLIAASFQYCPACKARRLRRSYDLPHSDDNIYFTCRACGCSVRTDMQLTMQRGAYKKDPYFDANC